MGRNAFGAGSRFECVQKKFSRDSTAPTVLGLKSPRAGFVSRCDAKIIGEVIRDLGGGRLTKDSVINFDVGMDKIAKPGERVEKDSILARIHAADKKLAEAVISRIQSAFEISAKPPKVLRLIQEVIQ